MRTEPSAHQASSIRPVRRDRRKRLRQLVCPGSARRRQGRLPPRSGSRSSRALAPTGSWTAPLRRYDLRPTGYPSRATGWPSGYRARGSVAATAGNCSAKAWSAGPSRCHRKGSHSSSSRITRPPVDTRRWPWSTQLTYPS